MLWLLGSRCCRSCSGPRIAYFLDPLADRLERLGLNRVAATTVIAVGGGAGASPLVLIFAVPALIAQVQALVAATPDYIANSRRSSAGAIPELFEENSRAACAA